jgi:hypothetical protein
MTLRPQNRCADCGHCWYPRGNHVSRRCPDCQSPAVRVVIPEAHLVAPDAPPARPNYVLAAAALACLLVFAICFGAISSRFRPKDPSDKAEKPAKSKPERRPDGDGDAEPFQPKHNPLSKTEAPKQQPDNLALKAELLDAPDQELAPVEVALHPDTFRRGQVGSFKTGVADAAQHATVLAIVSPSSAKVRALGDEFILSGIRTDNLVPDKAVYLRGKWEVVGLATHNAKQLYEVTHLVEASEVAERAAKKAGQADDKAKPKPPSSTIQPVYPTAEQIRSQSKGGPVQVRGYYRSNGTYVAPHARAAPGGRR